MHTAHHPQACRVFTFPKPAAPEVTFAQTRFGRIREFECRGADRVAVNFAANERMSAIDPYRSPAVVSQRVDGDDYVVTFRYYAFD